MAAKNICQCSVCGKTYRMRKDNTFSKPALKHKAVCGGELQVLTNDLELMKMKAQISYLIASMKKFNNMDLSAKRDIAIERIVREARPEQTLECRKAMGDVMTEMKELFSGVESVFELLKPIEVIA